MHPDYKDVGKITTRTIEECSELIKALCKAERFGWFTWHPDDVTKTFNIEKTYQELLDVKETVQELLEYLIRIKLKQTWALCKSCRKSVPTNWEKCPYCRKEKA